MSDKKLFHVFICQHFESMGGLSEYKESFCTFEEAKAYCDDRKDGYGFTHEIAGHAEDGSLISLSLFYDEKWSA